MDSFSALDSLLADPFDNSRYSKLGNPAVITNWSQCD